MNKVINRVPTLFGPETGFEIAPIPAVPFRGTQETELERLKSRLLRKLLDEQPSPDLNAPLRRAANEAAGVAWLTPFPLLFFPALLEEKAGAAVRRQVKQGQIRLRTQNFLVKAAA